MELGKMANLHQSLSDLHAHGYYEIILLIQNDPYSTHLLLCPQAVLTHYLFRQAIDLDRAVQGYKSNARAVLTPLSNRQRLLHHASILLNFLPGNRRM
jgi:hypothetical protein